MINSKFIVGIWFILLTVVSVINNYPKNSKQILHWFLYNQWETAFTITIPSVSLLKKQMTELLLHALERSTSHSLCFLSKE